MHNDSFDLHLNYLSSELLQPLKWTGGKNMVPKHADVSPAGGTCPQEKPAKLGNMWSKTPTHGLSNYSCSPLSPTLLSVFTSWQMRMQQAVDAGTPRINWAL